MWEDIRLAALTSRGNPIEIEYERDGEKTTVVLNPIYDSEADTYYLGVLGGGEVMVCNLPQTFQYGFYAMGYTMRATVKSLAMLVTGQLSKDDVSGPVGMVKYVDETYDAVKDYGVVNIALNMINIALTLSISLGIMNLLPIPALDGGRLVFLLIEAVRGKPIPPEKEGMVHLGGMMALMVLMALVFINDITKFFR
jgi:regulator of sigma E protease